MALKEGNYQAIEIPFPQQGMNTTVTPQALPLNFARYLENVIPSKSGTANVRHGTAELVADQDLASSAQILRTMSYAKSDGSCENLVYCYTYTTDSGSPIRWESISSFSIVTGTSPVDDNYGVATPIQITYTNSGESNTIEALVTGTTNTPDESLTSITFVTTTATATSTIPHRLTTGASVTISGATGGDAALYNGTFTITVTSATTFTYTMGGTPSGNATGTLVFNPNGTIVSFENAFLPSNQEQGTKYAWLAQNQFSVAPVSNNANYPDSGRITLLISGADFGVTSITRVGTTATATTANNHNLPVGATVTISGATGGDAALYNGTFTIGNVTANTFDYTMSGTPSGAATGTLLYSFSEQQTSVGYISTSATSTPTFVISSLTLFEQPNPNLEYWRVRAVTSAAHGLKNGDTVTIAGATETDYNVTAVIFDVGTTTFYYNITGTPSSPATGSPTYSVPTLTVTTTNNILPNESGTILDQINHAGVPLTSVSYAVGSVKKLNSSTGAYTDVKTGLRANCIPRHITFLGNLIVVNGVDTPFYYDGTSATDMYDWVEDRINLSATSSALTKAWVDEDEFYIDTGATGDANYPDGGLVKLEISASGLGITSITNTNGVATVTTSANHNLPVGTFVTVSGAVEAGYNVTAPIISATANTFTYQMDEASSSPATGTPTYAFSDVEVTGTINGTTLSATGRLNVVLTTNILPDTSITIDKVYYQKFLPAFSYITAYKRYLYALMPGVPQPDAFRSPETRMQFAFTGTVNDLQDWYDDFGNLRSETIGNNVDFPENLEAIHPANGALVFFGRNSLQIFTGTAPPIAPDTANSISLLKIVPVGLFHGDALVPIGDDVAFISKFGLISLSSVNISQQFSAQASAGAEVDDSFNLQIDYAKRSLTNYLAVRAFKYPAGKFIGFKIAKKLLMFYVSNIAGGWFYFTGDFGIASDYDTDCEDRLILAINNKLYRYADKVINNQPRNWVDAVGGSIRWAWITPWIRATQGRWKNNRAEIYLDASSNVNFTVSFARNNYLSDLTDVNFEASQTGGKWDLSYWASAFWGANNGIPLRRFKFLASTFALEVAGNTNTGPIEIYQIRLYGKGE